MASGDAATYADITLGLNRRVGTFTGDSDLTALAYTGENTVDTLNSVPLVAGRAYRVKYVFNIIAITGANTLLVRIKAGGNQITYTNADAVLAAAGGIRQYSIECDYTAPVTGNVNFTTTAIRTVGSNNTQFRGAPSQPRSLTVEYAYG